MNLRKVLKKFGLLSASAMYIAAALLAVPSQTLADDTDVFFPVGGGAEEKIIRPNIMFILDTSGSMVGTNSLDGTGETRLVRMKNAFNSIMGSLSSQVNVGLMKFSGSQGGPVLFPVAHIDAYVDDIDTTASGNKALLLTITDAVSEANQTAGGAVTVAPTVLTLDSGTGSTNTRLALRFTNVAIPTGVKLAEAKLLLHGESSGADVRALNTTIGVEAVDDSSPFTTAANNISGRSVPTTIPWTIGAGVGTADRQEFESVDISAQLNTVLSRAGWCGGNAITIVITATSGDGIRKIQSSIGDGALTPILNLAYDPVDNEVALKNGCIARQLASQVSINSDDAFQYDTTVQPGCGPIYLNSTPSGTPSCGTRRKATTAALRFQNMDIKPGAKVRKAILQVVAQGASAATPTLTIKAENSDNPATYSNSNPKITGRTSLTAAVTAATTAWTAEQVVSIDVTNVVKDVVAQGNWAANDPISFVITGSLGASTSSSERSKPIYSRETAAGKAAKLIVSVEGPADRIKVRDYLKQLVNEFQGAGGTPTMGALYEAARYFRGENAFYGLTRSGGESITQTEVDNLNNPAGVVAQLRTSGRATFDYSVSSKTDLDRPAGCSVLNPSSTACELERWTGTRKYLSPITDGCQSNNIILLSDGDPNNGGMRSGSDGSINRSAEELIGAMIGDSSCAGTASSSSNGSTRTNCGPELANFLFSNDQVPNSVLGGNQIIKTHAIAFGKDVGPSTTGGAFLRSISVGTPAGTGGGGQFFTATSTAEVAEAFDAIISEILDNGTTFVAPAVTVNTFNRLTNRNELYFALFEPNGGVNWKGNLKRYQLAQVGAGTPEIYDQNQALAVDNSTGFFSQNSCSFWTAKCNDGAKVAEGGAASRMTNNRKVYTSLGGAGDLTAAGNLVHEDNAAITNALLNIGAATADERKELLQWTRGIDVTDDDGDGDLTDARTSLGDPLHSEPTLISYGGTDADPDLAIFFGDNHGYFHAIEASVGKATSGTEYFSFIPEELMDNLNIYYQGNGSYTSRPYGMDGPITSFVTDINKDGSVSAGETATLFIGMRRGGRSYYALDVTDRTKPKLKYRIQGGVNSALGDFRELGQSWSDPVVARIRFNGKDYDGKSGQGPALIFTGGYDEAQDSKTNLFSGTLRDGDSQGRAVFVVDAATGKLLWWAGHNGTATPDLNFKTGTTQDMVYSVAASPAPVDLDGDGFVDRIYAADTGGQVFRIVLEKDGSNKPSLSNASGSMIAKLAVAGAAGSRRFFNAPDVAIIAKNVSKPFVSISIGTGHRERPLDGGTEDRFYVLKDPDLTNDAPTTFLINGDADLYDATSNDAGSANAATALAAKVAIAAKKGLYLRLGASEKILTESTTFNSQVIFASYSPTGASNACQASAGQSRFYQINIADATPVQNFDGVGTTTELTAADRSKPILVAGLPPNPVILYPSIREIRDKDGNLVEVCSGANCNVGQLSAPVAFVGAADVGLGFDRPPPFKTYWRNVE